MNTFMLAEMASKMDYSGVFCLASILFLIIALLAYCTGLYSGSSMCLLFFVIAVFATGDTSESEGLLSHSANKAYIANRSQTKIIEIDKYSINHPDCVFRIVTNSDGMTDIDADELFIPAEERVIKDGCWVMKSTGELPTDDDYYLHNKTFDPINVDREHGGSGISRWIYHPASPCVIFGIGALPCLLVIGYIKKLAA